MCAAPSIRLWDRWHAIDVLINNAGVMQVGQLEHMTHEDFRHAMATHFWGPLRLLLEIVPIMQYRGFGRIVKVVSIGGKIAVPHLAPYCASKFALLGLSDAVRAELDRYGIRVTTVTPDAHWFVGQLAVSAAMRPSTPGSRSRARSPGCRSTPNTRPAEFSTPAAMATPS